MHRKFCLNNFSFNKHWLEFQLQIKENSQKSKRCITKIPMHCAFDEPLFSKIEIDNFRIRRCCSLWVLIKWNAFAVAWNISFFIVFSVVVACQQLDLWNYKHNFSTPWIFAKSLKRCSEFRCYFVFGFLYKKICFQSKFDKFPNLIACSKKRLLQIMLDRRQIIHLAATKLKHTLSIQTRIADIHSFESLWKMCHKWHKCCDQITIPQTKNKIKNL